MTYQYEYGTEPFNHQHDILQRMRDLPAFGLLWEQGCAKSKPLIDNGAYLYETEKIDAMLVVAPAGVERNWMTDEIPKHLPERLKPKTKCFLWRSIKSGTKWHKEAFNNFLRYPGLSVFLISYDAFMSKEGKKAVWRFLKQRRCLYILDESDDIKTPKAKRTRSIGASGVYAPYRRIATGTPGDKPFDYYSQLKFLEPDIWQKQQMGNFFAFKQHFGIWRTRQQCLEENGFDPGYDMLLGYKNEDELTAIIQHMCDRLLKKDVLDLPEKLYTKIWFEMTPRQRALYDKLRDEYEIELDSGAIVDGNMAITRLLRLQQITCGYMVTDAEEPIELCDKKNPRLDATVAWAERLNHPAIIWCRFIHDIDQLMDALGPRACRYDGTIGDDECERSKLMFNNGEKDYFVGNPQKGARGLTMNVAKSTGFYSNSFKLRDRLQAEDRNHRAGQEAEDHGEHGTGILYADVMAVDSVDIGMIENLRQKFDIAGRLVGDELRQWI